MSIAGPASESFWRQQQTTLSELLLRAGNQRAARLLSLVSAAELGEADVWDPVQVVLLVRPIFLDLFRPAELQAITEQMDQLKSWDASTGHQVTVAPLLADPFARTTFGAGTTAVQLREAIADALHPVKSYDLPDVCQAFGLAEGNGEEAYASKRGYVRSRIQDYTQDQLFELGSRVVEAHYLPELWGLLQVLGDRQRGVHTPFRNIIFAADGPKPELVLADAVSNTIEIVKNEQFCLVFDRPLDEAGLTWTDLLAWWASTHAPAGSSDRDAANQLHARLARSLDADRPTSTEPGPERQMFLAYTELLKQHGFGLPALIPQVYLHYDPYSQHHRRATGPLPRQRMDFLMLLRGRRRLVIEIDGKQHYANGDQASPRLYADMMREDRTLRLGGYEVYRFGGAEFRDIQEARTEMRAFFGRILASHGYLKESSVSG
jgi:very-short-patch-repair endonuclease